MPAIEAGQLALEKTPGYFHSPKAAERLAGLNRDVKLLLIVRDPVKRLISDYNQFRTKNLDQGQSYPDLEDLVFTEDGNINLNYPPLQRSIYHHHMTRFVNKTVICLETV